MSQPWNSIKISDWGELWWWIWMKFFWDSEEPQNPWPPEMREKDRWLFVIDNSGLFGLVDWNCVWIYSLRLGLTRQAIIPVVVDDSASICGGNVCNSDPHINFLLALVKKKASYIDSFKSLILVWEYFYRVCVV